MDKVSINMRIYTEDTDEAMLRQISIGLKPLILIEPSVSDDDPNTVELLITSSLCGDDAPELAGFLTEIAEYATQAAQHGEYSTEEP
jgi:hypothetical protein